MSVIISSVDENSPAFFAKIKAGYILHSINNHNILDVLDYRFYQNEKRLKLKIQTEKRIKTFRIKKQEFEEIGLNFDTYLMDKQRACKNNCIFCFIDQLPKGMRETLYFKDDDSRLSFLFGNYITLTNITEHEVERIIKMHISPINISVHTTNPELRCKMMNNRFAGDSLSVLYKLANAGININCQLVLCPGYNDGDELRRSLKDLTALPSVQSIAAVPVGLTGHRENLQNLEPFNKITASAVLDIINEFGDRCVSETGHRRVFAADEFYILSERKIPPVEFYDELLQLENGVGMWSLLLDETEKCIENYDKDFTLNNQRHISLATGEAAYPLIKNIVDNVCKKWHNLKCDVYKINNRFFGGKITVTGLLTASDLLAELKGKQLGDELLISSSMLRHENDRFLDDITVDELETKLNVKITVVNNDGYELIDALLGNKVK